MVACETFDLLIAMAVWKIYCTARLVMVNGRYVGFEVFTALTMKNAVFWDVVLCGFCKNQRFGGTYRLHL
jgi:hypothetical protein